MERNHSNRGGLRPSIGYRIVAAAFVFLVAFGYTPMLFGEEPSPAPPLKIVSAGSVAYKDTYHVLSLKNGVTGPVSGVLTNASNGPCGYPFTVSEGGAELALHVHDYLCDAAGGFALIEAPADVDVVTIVTYDDGAVRTSLAIGPIGAVTHDRPSIRRGPLVNEHSDGAYITTFASIETPMSVEIRDGRNIFLPIVEDFTASPPASQYRIQTEGIYFATVRMGWHVFGCFPSACSSYPPVYGFASSGDARGGNFREFPFGATP